MAVALLRRVKKVADFIILMLELMVWLTRGLWWEMADREDIGTRGQKSGAT